MLPHAEAEDRVLYPAVARLMGAPEATRTMSRDHLAIFRLGGELDELRKALHTKPLSDGQLKALRRVLYGLHAVVKLHLAKEEEPKFSKQARQSRARASSIARPSRRRMSAKSWRPARKT